MNMRLFVITAFFLLFALSCSSQGGGGNSGGDSDTDNSWPFQPDGDDVVPNYECNADVDCNDPSYKCEDHFCVPRNLPDGDDEYEEDDSSEWPCGIDCSKLPNVYKAHCVDQEYCEIDECWPAYANCDDKYENGCEQEIYVNMDNCGKCNRRCRLDNASEECVEGQCLIVACEGDYQDADGLDSSGCECMDTGQEDEFGDNRDTDCDGMDGEIENLIFVSEDGIGDGSRENPLGDIQEAIDMALDGQVVLVSKGDYAGPITLREGISIYGGWDTDFRGRAYENEVNVLVNTWLNQEDESLPMNFVGLYAEGIHNSTRIEIINIIIEDNISPSGSNIGMWISDCNHKLSFSHVKVQTGTGGDGLNGNDGRSGSKGLQGQQGQPGCENDSNFFCGDSNCSIPQGGRGGDSPCGNDGGIGGVPGLGNDDGQDNPGQMGGTGAGGTAGGAGGMGADNMTDEFECECEGCSNCTWTNGEQGKFGKRGEDGTKGAGGKAEGEIIDGMWFATHGGNGGNGKCGAGGGGGGGGGGGRCGSAHDCKRYGSAGSGGGGGGKGGTGGTGGKGGGASIGVLMLASSPYIKYSEIISGDGGKGGNGGIGGEGGEGGLGGPEPEFGSNQRSGGCGGAGGDGGAGGNGGDGGGGAGGPSWGFYLLENCWPNLVEVTITHGRGGSGGSGGEYGATGRSGDIYTEEVEVEDGDGDEESEPEIELEQESELEEFEPELEAEPDFEAETESDGDTEFDNYDEFSEFDLDAELESELDSDMIETEELQEPDPEPDEDDIWITNPERDRDFDIHTEKDYDFVKP